MGGILPPEVVLCCTGELEKPEPVNVTEIELTVHIPLQQLTWKCKLKSPLP